jgi:uncharacterized protein
MAGKKKPLKIVSRYGQTKKNDTVQPQVVSARWLLTALAIVLLAAVACAWGTMCLLFWQGSWQLLYHPRAAVTRTPASIGLPFEAMGFAATETGQLQLRGWLIPAAHGAPFSQYTVLYLHGATGNLGDTVNTLAEWHAAGVNVFAFDYRGYGQSQFAHPSEANWRQDAEWALAYLTATRHVNAGKIIVAGDGLGADLAAEVAAAHPELAGVALQAPDANPASAIFDDPRARLLPARALVHDRWNLDAAVAAVRIPSLWLVPSHDAPQVLAAYQKGAGNKKLVQPDSTATELKNILTQWLSTLGAR